MAPGSNRYTQAVDTAAWGELFVAIKSGVDWRELRTSLGLPILGKAVADSNIQAVESLLKLGVKPWRMENQAGPDFSPIWGCLERRNIKVLQLLLDYGADPNEACPSDASLRPIHYTSRTHWLKATIMLLGKGAWPDGMKPANWSSEGEKEEQRGGLVRVEEPAKGELKVEQLGVMRDEAGLARRNTSERNDPGKAGLKGVAQEKAGQIRAGQIEAGQVEQGRKEGQEQTTKRGKGKENNRERPMSLQMPPSYYWAEAIIREGAQPYALQELLKAGADPRLATAKYPGLWSYIQHALKNNPQAKITEATQKLLAKLNKQYLEEALPRTGTGKKRTMKVDGPETPSGNDRQEQEGNGEGGTKRL